MRFPLSGELQTGQLLDRFGLHRSARVNRLGVSRAGRPIDLISVGDGARSALIVGAPHPNEPTGTLTIMRMLKRLGAERHLPEAPDWQWHFIPAIDIDGLALNESWFADPLTLEGYCAGFYRPAFRTQPEYSFPLDSAGYRFDAETPESACWRAALELAQPDLQCSLHGADTGGSFFILSEDSAVLADQLALLPERFSITLNAIGEPFAELTAYRPGVFFFPPVLTTPGWNAGNSSAGFARDVFGTLSMTCEVPLWHDVRETSGEISQTTSAQVVDGRIAQLREDHQLLADTLPSITAEDSFETQALMAALHDARLQAAAGVAALEQARPEPSSFLPVRDLCRLEAGTAALRSPAMLARLATRVGDDAARVAAERVLIGRLDGVKRTTRLTPVPLERATSLQVAAIIEAARLTTSA